MATETEKRVIVVDVKGSQAAVAHMKQLQKAAKNVDTNLSKMRKGMVSLGNTMKAFIAYRMVAYFSQIVPAVLEAADSMDLMAARLGLVARAGESTVETMGLLFDIADRSRGSIDAVATLYTRLAASTESLGTSQQELLDFTELVSDTFVLSGASAGEAASGVTQLSQAMAKGKLDGDEFKSIMENNVYFGKLLSQTLGVTRGELQEMSKAGQITDKVLLQMAGNIDEVREQMEGMPVTVGQAVTSFENSFKRLVGSDNSFARFVSKTIAGASKAVNEFAQSMEDSAKAADDAANQLRTDRYEELQRQYVNLNRSLNLYVQNLFTLEQMGEGQSETTKRNQAFMLQYAQAVGLAADELKRMREEMQIEEFEKLPEPPAPPEVKLTDRQKTLNSYAESLKKAEGQTALFTDKLTILDNMFFRGDISESIYNTELEKLTGNLESGTTEMEEYAEAMETLNNVAQGLRTPIEVLADEMAELDAIGAKFPETLEKVKQLQAEMAKGFTPPGANDKNKEEILDWAEVAEKAIDGVADSFIDMALDGKTSFADFAQSFVKDITKMIIKRQLLAAFDNIGKDGGFLGGLFPSAKGNVFENGSVTPFANGGVVSQPTVFPMANGAGLMGEAGPEAIMPLERDSSGRLGVSGGGGNNVTINITIVGGTGDPDAIRQSAGQVAQAAGNATSRAMRRNG